MFYVYPRTRRPRACPWMNGGLRCGISLHGPAFGLTVSGDTTGLPVELHAIVTNNRQLYIGCTKDLKRRREEHRRGKVFATKKYLPIALVYYECYLSEKDAKHREFMLKKYGSAHVHLKKRVADSIKKSQGRG